MSVVGAAGTPEPRLLRIGGVSAVTLAFVYVITVVLFTFAGSLRGVFNRPTAYLAIAVGSFGIAALSGQFVTIILNAVCTIVWLLFIGYRLYRLGQQ